MGPALMPVAPLALLAWPAAARDPRDPDVFRGGECAGPQCRPGFPAGWSAAFPVPGRPNEKLSGVPTEPHGPGPGPVVATPALVPPGLWSLYRFQP